MRAGRRALLFCVLHSAFCISPGPAPAGAPAGGDLQRWLDELDHTDPAVRDAARVGLMGMGRGRLEQFRDVVARNRPLSASQAAVLREIVTHVYLSGDPYESTRQGWLGVMMHESNASTFLPPPAGPDGDAAPGTGPPARPFPAQGHALGVVVAERFEGFCAARALEDGDTILGIDADPALGIVPAFVVRDIFSFGKAVQKVPPGSTIRLKVLRRGRVLRVAVTLDPRPTAADYNAMPNFNSRRHAAGRRFWRESFEPLLRADASRVRVDEYGPHSQYRRRFGSERAASVSGRAGGSPAVAFLSKLNLRRNAPGSAPADFLTAAASYSAPRT